MTAPASPEGSTAAGSKRIAPSLLLVLSVAAAATHDGCVAPQDSGSSAEETDMDGGVDKIVNGQVVDNIEQLPFAAYIEGCSGTFIHPRWVLSAAHCFRPDYEARKEVRYGSPDRTNAARVASRRTYSLAEYRELSDDEAWGVEPFDIVLIELEKPATLSNTSIALLPMSRSLKGEAATLAGWGATESSSRSTKLRQVNLTVSGPCVATNKFCATGQGAAGSGDSGGGIYRRTGDRYEILGITSTSDRKGWTSFTEVHAYLNWIASVSGITRSSQLADDPGDSSVGLGGLCRSSTQCASRNCHEEGSIARCRPPSCSAVATPGDANFCEPGVCGPCRVGEGDCDNDAQCAANSACVQVDGPDYCQARGADGSLGLGSSCRQDAECQSGNCHEEGTTDRCRPSRCASTRPGDSTFCAPGVCGPCRAGEGDCDSDSECLANAYCAQVSGTDYCRTR